MQFRTTFGDVDVELYDLDKPVTVQNFIRYVKSGAYQNLFLHRCLPGFVVQGGGFSTGNMLSASPFAPTNGNLYVVPAFGPITNEFNVGRRFTNNFGTIAMAKSPGDPNSASSQWFFNLADNSANLDTQNGGFTVFGRAIRGTNILGFFNSLNKAAFYGIVDMRESWGSNNFFGQTFSDLPVNYAGHFYPRYSDLVYVYDISFLNVQVQQLTNHTHVISWNSVTNATNYVEFTTNLPPVWHPLLTMVSTNVDRTILKVTDVVTNAPRRFYRVRVSY